jgi:integrase
MAATSRGPTTWYGWRSSTPGRTWPASSCWRSRADSADPTSQNAWSDIEDQIDPLTGDARTGIHVIQKKTGVQLWIPFTRELSAAIEIWRPTRRPPFFLALRADGTPFDRNALSWAWNQERARNPALAPLEAAGLVVHGLRATAVVRARQRGATVLQISSMFGMSEPMVARYSRLADQREMAMAAVHHIDGTRQEQMRAKDLKTYS